MSRNVSRKPRAAAYAWRVMDLHLHTSASSDYQEPQVTYLNILQKAEARSLDIIAFTDHNTVAGYRKMREEIAELELLERLQRLNPAEKTRLAEYRRLLHKLLVLPGFEFTATFGFHIIGIFSPDTPVRDIEHILLSLRVPSEQLDLGSATVGATADVLTAYSAIHEAGGVVIAAHANSSNGVAMRGFTFGGQTKIAYTQDPHLHALEVTDLDQKGRRATAAFFNGSKPEYPRRMHCIQGSDAHRLTRDLHNAKNLGVGDRTTDVRLAEVAFDDLKALFESNDFARTRPHLGKAQPEFDYVQRAREEGPNIVQNFHESAMARGGRLHAVIADVCAFANTNGGTIYVGVSVNPGEKSAGVENPAQVMNEIRSAIDRLLTPSLACTVDTLETKGKTVVRILVPRGDDPPYAIEDNKIYLREEAETSLAVRDEIVRLVLRGQPTQLERLAHEGAAPASAPVGAGAERAPAQAAPAEMPAPEMAPAGPAEPEPLRPPRTGVEIVAAKDRDGIVYYTVRDLRNGSTVKNVTRASARKLWHYAITQKETEPLDPAAIVWHGDLGLWKKRRVLGAIRYDLVQRVDAELRVYYGVTDDGVHGEWKQVVGGDEEG